MTRAEEKWKLRALVFLPAVLVPLIVFGRLFPERPEQLASFALGIAATSAFVAALRLAYLRDSLSAAQRSENPLLAPRLRGVLIFAVIEALWLRLFFPADAEVWRFVVIAVFAATVTPAYAGPRQFRPPAVMLVLALQWVFAAVFGGGPATPLEPVLALTPGGAPLVSFAIYELLAWAALRAFRAPASVAIALATAVLAGLSLAPLIGLERAVGAAACIYAVRDFPGRPAEPPGRSLILGLAILAGVAGLPAALGYANFAGAMLPEALPAAGGILCATLLATELTAALFGAYPQRAARAG